MIDIKNLRNLMFFLIISVFDEVFVMICGFDIVYVVFRVDVDKVVVDIWLFF